MFRIAFLFSFLTFFSFAQEPEVKLDSKSIACIWMEAYLESIKKDGLGPTIHARNLYHISAAMYDVWHIYNPDRGDFLFLGKNVNGFNFEFDGFEIPANKDSALFVSISYAAYRLMINRFNNYSSKLRVNDDLIFLMEDLGLNPNYYSDDYSNGSAAGLGNYIGNLIFEFGLTEPAGDENGYEGPGSEPANYPLKPNVPGNKNLRNKNRWQPLSVIDYINEKGWDSTLIDWNYQLIPITDIFLTPHWSKITPFAMTNEDKKILKRDGDEFIVYNDPGPPAIIQEDLTGLDSYRWNHSLVGSWSSHNDPKDETIIDISPAAIGPTNGLLPSTLQEYADFFDFEKGGTLSVPNKKNPVTGELYQKNLVKRGDYTRVIAEYWVDAVNTYSPPGHWMKMLCEVSTDDRTIKKWNGKGEELSQLEWDVKSFLTLSGALHDAAISSWSIKAYYDYVRPISAIRWMSDNGQCSDTLLPRYHPEGLRLIPGKVELVKEDDPLVGKDGKHLNKIKIMAWRGPDYINKPEEDVAGVGWILAENWWPYQRYSFVTPPFAGYVSGHSTFSIAAAETIANITGSPYFPGGLREEKFKANEFLEFELGPSQDLTLQWATYREAGDETCLSRIWGGIHPPVDDIEGRKVGEKVAKQVFEFVNELF